MKALPREVWAETEGLETVCTSGEPEMSCLLWITAVSGQAAWVCKLPGALRGRCFWNSEQLFGCLGSLGWELMGTWRHGQEGEGQAWCAKCGLLGATPGDFPRPDPDTAEGARWPVSWGEPASDGVTWTGVLASLAQETTGHGGSVTHGQCPPLRSHAARCLEGGWEPPLPQQICKQRQKDVLSET